jgi:predicted heme/steroid binding protein
MLCVALAGVLLGTVTSLLGRLVASGAVQPPVGWSSVADELRRVVFRQQALITPQQLAARDGSGGDPLWLAVGGHVFDVTSGRQHYGPGGGYAFFTGKDGSAAFVTGAFNETGAQTHGSEGASFPRACARH